MQENLKDGQDDSDIVETSEPFTITRAALNRQIISSEDYNWLKQRPAKQLGVHLSAILLVCKCRRTYQCRQKLSHDKRRNSWRVLSVD